MIKTETVRDSWSQDPEVPWIGYYLNQAAQRIRVSTAAALQPLGITPVQLRILEAILAEQPLSQARLGEITGTDRTTIVAIVDRLETLGAAARNRDPNDRRSHAVVLTPVGERVLGEARTRARVAEQAFLAPLAPADRSALHALLIQLHQPITCLEEIRK